MSVRYFVEPPSGALPRRYFILKGNRIVAVQTSRPDGIEVERPPNASLATPATQAVASVPEPKVWHFNNQRPESAARARRNAGEKLRRWSEWNKKRANGNGRGQDS